MAALLTWLLLVFRLRLKSQARLAAENVALRQQVIVLNRRSRRVRLRNIDRLIFVCLYRLFPSIVDAVVVVTPETIIRWHRRGFRAYWHWRSRRRGGRPRVDREIRTLIRRMSRENPPWGAPRIHGELLMLGIEVSESTVGRYMIRNGRPPRRVGRCSWAITPPESLRSISSWCAPSRSSCSTRWSFFDTRVGDWSGSP